MTKPILLYGILFLLGLAGIFNLSGQTYYSNLSTHTFPAAVGTGCILKNDRLYINGMVLDSVPPYQTLNLISEIDLTTGDAIWTKEYAYSIDQPSYWNNAFIENPFSNGFVTAGSTGDKGVILFYDSTGTVINSIALIDSTVQYLNPKDLIIHNGYLYCLGTQQQFDYDGNIFVYKLDLNGNIIWKQSYGIPSLTELAGCIISYGDNLIIGSGRSTLNHVPYTVEEQSHTWIFSIDTIGNVLHEWLDPDNKTYWPNEMLFAPNGNLVYVGAYRGNYIWSNWNETLYLGYAVELNLITEVKRWSWTNDSYGPLAFFNDIKDKGTGYIITGTTWNDKGWIIVTDYDGNIHWNRKYYGIDPNYPYAWSELKESVELSNGDILSVGHSLTFLNNYNQEQQSWILRTDTTACLTCYLYGLDENQSFEKVVIYPNPFYSDLTIESKSSLEIQQISIVDMLGKEVFYYKNSPCSKTVHLNLETLAAGQYLIKVNYKGGAFSSNKIIKN